MKPDSSVLDTLSFFLYIKVYVAFVYDRREKSEEALQEGAYFRLAKAVIH